MSALAALAAARSPHAAAWPLLAAAAEAVQGLRLIHSSRCSALQDIPGAATPELFDRQQKAAQRDRAAALRSALHRPDPLLVHITDRLLDRLEDCVAKFPTAVILGGAGDVVAEGLAGGRAGIEKVIHIDSSPEMIKLAQERAEAHKSRPHSKPWPETFYVVADEELLPLAPNSVDLVVSCLGLHWVNDVPGALAQVRQALKPDGLFLGAMFGGQTLQEFRISCSLAQQEREGGVSPFVSPMAQVRDAGNLLTRAELALPTVDLDTFHMRYSSAVALISHLRLMAESNALKVKQGSGLKRDTALAAAAAYQSLYCDDEEYDHITATYQVIFMTGWSPSRNTPKAAKRGSATVSFHEMAAELQKRGAVAGTAEEAENSTTAAAESAGDDGSAAGSKAPGQSPS